MPSSNDYTRRVQRDPRGHIKLCLFATLGIQLRDTDQVRKVVRAWLHKMEAVMNGRTLAANGPYLDIIRQVRYACELLQVDLSE